MHCMKHCNFKEKKIIINLIYMVDVYDCNCCYGLYSVVLIFVVTVIQGVSQLVDITTGGDFLGLRDQKSSYKHVSDFGRLRSYDRLKLRIEVNDY